MSVIRVGRIEIENFKSFKGLNVIDKLKDLTAVIGPNGSGKSNFMDAVCFAVGEKTTGLRVKKLADLIHGSVVKRPVSCNASVTLIFENVHMSEEITFRRSIRGNSSEYVFNNAVINRNDYIKELENIGIITRAGNCFVFQGAVESIAMKHPKEMTKLFEEISGSAELREQYDTLKAQFEEGQKKLGVMYRRKKHLAADCVEAKRQGKVAEQYQQNFIELNEMSITHCLFKLFYNERRIKSLETNLKSRRVELNEQEGKAAEAEEKLKTAKKDLGKCERDSAKTEQEIREAEVDLTRKKSRLVKAKEEVSHVQKKLDGALKTLEKARKADEEQTDDVNKLEEELAEANRAKEEYRAEILEESQGVEVQVEEEYVQQYGRLKSEAAKRTAHLTQELESINRINRSDQDRLDNTERLIDEARDKLGQTEREEKELNRRIRVLGDHILASEEALADKRQRRTNLESEVATSRERLQTLQKELEAVMEQIGDEKANKYEEEHRKRKTNVLEHLQLFYTGVYGRMADLCQPTNSRYNIAFTKVFGNNMESIVVDTEQTARRCIKYLKEQRLGRETFLPIDYVKWQPIKARLRAITEPKNVFLLYDLLTFEPQEIEPVVLCVAGNVLVCQTPEDASRVCYDLDSRNNAVALDGTYYQKSGLISGGSVDLAKRAKRWNEKHMAQLKEQKEELTEALRAARTNSHKQSEIDLLDIHIAGLESRLKYFRTDLKNTEPRARKNQAEVSRLAEETDDYRMSAESIQQAMRAREPKIQELEAKLNGIEDAVFADFCERIGVRNLRQYESRELLVRERHKQKRQDLQARIDKISNLLAYERDRAAQSNVTRWADTVDEEKRKLAKYGKHENKMRDEMSAASQEVDRLKSEHSQVSREGDALRTQVSKAKNALGGLNRKVQAAYKQVVVLESEMERKKSERHAILLDSKVDALDLPLLAGNMEDIAESDPSQTSSLDASASLKLYEKEDGLHFDYNKLPKKLKKLADEEEIARASEELLRDMQSKRDLLSQEMINTHADEKLRSLLEELKREKEAYNRMIKEVKENTQAYDGVKKRRLELFTGCFQHVSNEIDIIYKDLTKCEYAKAMLSTTDEEEPYLGSVNYHCTAPEKRFQMMTNMSGGEKTLAALALVFAIHSYKPAPFLVLDEVDAALDKVNIAQVVSYLQEKIWATQIIVISLKEEFYAGAKLLIGLDANSEDCLVSKFVSLDFDNYNHLL